MTLGNATPVMLSTRVKSEASTHMEAKIIDPFAHIVLLK